MQQLAQAMVNQTNMQQVMQDQQAGLARMVQEMTQAIANTTGVQQSQTRVENEKLNQNVAKDMDEFRGEGFAGWKFRVINDLRSKDPRLADMLKWAEKRDKTIIDYTSDETTRTADYQDIFKQMGTWLYTAFVKKLRGEPFDMMMNVEDGNGAEVWRRLCDRYQGKTFGKQMHLTRRAINPGKVKKLSEALSAVEKWEQDVVRLRLDYGLTLGDDLQTAVLLEMMPVSVTEMMVQRITPKQPFKEVKDLLLRYIETRQDFDGIKPMDVGALQEREENKDWEEDQELDWMGKGGKGGKGGGFPGRCSWCGQYGHKASECPRRKGPQTPGKGGYQGCWTCGSPDHRAADCLKGKGKGKEGKDGKGNNSYYNQLNYQKGGQYYNQNNSGKGWGNGEARGKELGRWMIGSWRRRRRRTRTSGASPSSPSSRSP